MWAGFPNREWATFEKLEALIGDNHARGLLRKFLQKELSKKQNPLLQEKLASSVIGRRGGANGGVPPRKSGCVSRRAATQ